MGAISLRICLVTGLLVLSGPFAAAGGIDDIHVLKISGRDERAVVKLSDGKTKVIKTGDALNGATVIEIAHERIVLKEQKGDETGAVIIRLVDGKQSIERIRKTGEKRPELLMPQPVRTAPAKDEKKRGSGVK